MHKLGRSSLRVAVFAALMGAASSVWAQPENAQPEKTVEPLIQQGIELRKAHKDEAALEVFLQAEPQAPNDVRLLLHITTAAQAAGKWVLAHQYLQRVVTHTDDPYYQRHEEAISAVVEAIRRRVGELQVTGSPTGAEVRLNGIPVGYVPFAAPLPLEVGSYTLEVNKDGYYKLRRPVDIVGGGLTREVAALNERPLGAPASAETAEQRGFVTAAPDDAASGWSAPWVRWTFASLAVASAGVSGVTLYLRENRVQEWNDDSACLSSNPGQTRREACGDVRNSAKTLETVSVISGVAALAFGGVALTHWLATTPSSSDGERDSQAQLACSPGLLALSCAGSF